MKHFVLILSLGFLFFTQVNLASNEIVLPIESVNCFTEISLDVINSQPVNEVADYECTMTLTISTPIGGAECSGTGSSNNSASEACSRAADVVRACTDEVCCAASLPCCSR